MSHDFPRIVSVDDHVIEPPHVWQTYLPERFRAEGPRVVRSGMSGWGAWGASTRGTRIPRPPPVTSGCSRTCATR